MGTVSDRLIERHGAWTAKPGLRAVYGDMFARMQQWMLEGQTLEVGGGSGLSHDFLPGVLSTDVLPSPWIDVAADCHALPFSDGAFVNLVMLDVLHHLASVPAFLAEAARVLAPGGRLIMVEPAMTAFSLPLYRLLHEEPVDMAADPLVQDAGRTGPFDANQAVPTLLFGRHRRRLEQEFPQFQVTALEHFALWAYPLSGGYRGWSLLPAGMVAPLLSFERCLEKHIARWIGFRLLAVLSRAG